MFSEKYLFESMKVTKNWDASKTLLYNICNITSTEIYFFQFRHLLQYLVHEFCSLEMEIF